MKNKIRNQVCVLAMAVCVRFSEDGKRLFVLTANQTVYVLDLSSLPVQSQPAWWATA